jgi:LysR family glycine cleavage system transcriptional activator
VLSLSVVDGFATNWLVPRLGAFQLIHSKIAVKLGISGELVDFKSGDVDVGIRTGRGDWPGLVMHRLFAVSYTPMLSPQLLEAAGPVHTPADLLKLPLLDPLDSWWVDWFVGAGIEPADLSRRTEMRVYLQNLAAAAAIAGHGVAMLTPAFFAHEVAAGRLVQPFPLVRHPGSDYWLVYPEARRRSPKIRAFRDWLLAAIRKQAETHTLGSHLDGPAGSVGAAKPRPAGSTWRAPEPVTS